MCWQNWRRSAEVCIKMYLIWGRGEYSYSGRISIWNPVDNTMWATLSLHSSFDFLPGSSLPVFSFHPGQCATKLSERFLTWLNQSLHKMHPLNIDSKYRHVKLKCIGLIESSVLVSSTDNGLNGDLLSDDERSGSELGDDGDSMDSDKGGVLNLSNDRIHNNNNTSHHHHHHHPAKNGSVVNSQSNGHGQLGSSPTLNPTAASVQAALAAIQAGQLSLNQVQLSY